MANPTATYKEHYLYPAGLYAPIEPYKVSTVLGSCVAVCLYDEGMKVGGINHFMLPLWNGEGLASPKYGNIAIEKLLDKMINQGSSIINIKAKIFGGKMGSADESVYRIGQRNIALAEDTLREMKIPIIGKSVGGEHGRKILFFTDTGQVLMKYLKN